MDTDVVKEWKTDTDVVKEWKMDTDVVRGLEDGYGCGEGIRRWIRML